MSESTCPHCRAERADVANMHEQDCCPIRQAYEQGWLDGTGVRRGADEVSPITLTAKLMTLGTLDNVGPHCSMSVDCPDGVEHVLCRWHECPFQNATKGNRRVRCRHTLDRGVQEIESLVDAKGGDVPGDRTAGCRLVDDHHPPRLLERGEDRRFIQG